jgi:D-alanine-D-alanine ligase
MKILILYNVAVSLKRGVEGDLDCEQEILVIVPLAKAILELAGHTVTALECDFDIWERLKRLRGSIDLIFNLAESFGGTNSDEPLIPAMLEALNLPFIGASNRNMCFALDKEKTKLIAKAFGVPVLPHSVFDKMGDFLNVPFQYPMIVKPIREEASIGIDLSSVVSDSDELEARVAHVIAAYRAPAIVEPFIYGREISVGVIGNAPTFTVFPPLEFLFPEASDPRHAFRSYEYKWGGKKEVMVRATINEETERLLTDYTLRLFGALDCRDYARVDYRLTPQGQIYMLEVNHNPGIGPNTHGLNNTLTKMASYCGIEFDALILKIVDIASMRENLPRSPA